MENFPLFLVERFYEYGDAIALKSKEKSIRYDELGEIIHSCARRLIRAGIKRGDVVGLTLEDELELAIFSLALGVISSTSICLPRSLTIAQRKDCLEKSGARFFLFREIVSAENGVQSVLRLVKMNHREGGLLNHHYAEGELLRIALGSGSTGDRKLIPITHDLMHHRMKIFDGAIPHPSGRRCASCVHIEYGLGYFRLLASLYRGLTHIFLHGDNANVVETIENESVNQLSLTVFHLNKLLEAKIRGKFSCDSLESLIIGSSVVPDELRNITRKFFGEILTITYGTNETMFLSVLNPKTPDTEKGSVGFPVQGVEIEVVSTDDSCLGVGELGRIRVKSPGLISGYLNRHPDNQKFFRDGWFYPGDLGRLSHGGELLFCGRADNMMVRNGINIYPAEIENCLLNFPGVDDAIVFPIKHRANNDLPVALVVSKRSDETFLGLLKTHANERLGFRAPFKIVIVDKLPRNDGGKIPKETLDQLVFDLFADQKILSKLNG